MKNQTPNFNFSITDGFEDDNQTLKFDLYLMTREVKQISNSLQNVVLLPAKQQHHWVKQNHAFLQEFMESLTHDMMDILSDINLDQDALQDTITCVTEVRELVTTLSSLMTRRPKLES